eukprot:jgi/Chlat1/6641/Chrsp49S06142
MAPQADGQTLVMHPAAVVTFPDTYGWPGRKVGCRRVFVQTETGNVVGVEVDRGDTVDKLKRRVQAALKVSTENSELRFGDVKLERSEDISTIRRDSPLLLTRKGLSRSHSTPCISPTSHDDMPVPSPLAKAFEVMSGGSSVAMRRLLRDCIKGVEKGIAPVRAEGGLGGAYYFRSGRGDNVAVVKPCDEEPMAPNNPNGFVGRAIGEPGMTKAVRVGEAAMREVAAFLLDHNQFANVPKTALVKVSHSIFHVASRTGSPPAKESAPVTKIASLQEFKRHDCDASEHGFSRFPVSAVHRIGIFDVRVFNTDRHAGNILVRSIDSDGLSSRLRHGSLHDDSLELVPIDHGFCLPEVLDAVYLEWLHWPQAAMPFSKEELEYIDALNVQEDIDMLRRELPMLREGCLRTLEVSTTLLKRAASAGLVLADIGHMLSRPIARMGEQLSDLEAICLDAYQVLTEEAVTGRDTGCISEEDDEDCIAESDEEEDSTQFLMDDDDAASQPTSPSSSTSLSPASGDGFGSIDSFSTEPSSSSDSSTPWRLSMDTPADNPFAPSRTVTQPMNTPLARRAFRRKSLRRITPLLGRTWTTDRNAVHPYIAAATGDATQAAPSPKPSDTVAFADMDDRQWKRFMEILVEFIDRLVEDKRRSPIAFAPRMGSSCGF